MAGRKQIPRCVRNDKGKDRPSEEGGRYISERRLPVADGPQMEGQL